MNQAASLQTTCRSSRRTRRRLRMAQTLGLTIALLMSVAPATPAQAVGPVCTSGDETGCDYGIRPGAPIVGAVVATPASAEEDGAEFVGCTMGFLVTDGVRVYMSTAGHCVTRSTDDDESSGGLGSRVRTVAPIGEFGTVRYLRCQPAAGGGDPNFCDTGHDFALVEIDRDMLRHADPAMLGWAAPERIYEESRVTSKPVRHTGWGLGVGSGGFVVQHDGATVTTANPMTQARQGWMLEQDQALVEATEPTTDRVTGGRVGLDDKGLPVAFVRAACAPADSGSPAMVLDDPLAPADLSEGTQALGIFTNQSPYGCTAERLDANLQEAQRVLGLSRPLTLWPGRGQDRLPRTR